MLSCFWISSVKALPPTVMTRPASPVKVALEPVGKSRSPAVVRLVVPKLVEVALVLVLVSEVRLVTVEDAVAKIPAVKVWRLFQVLALVVAGKRPVTAERARALVKYRLV